MSNIIQSYCSPGTVLDLVLLELHVVLKFSIRYWDFDIRTSGLPTSTLVGKHTWATMLRVLLAFLGVTNIYLQ